jgi:signal transduction histidine kinase
MAGSGLGLSITRQVAESHGGTVRAEAAPGGGTLIRLTLPEIPELPDDQERAVTAAADEPGYSARPEYLSRR